MSELVAEGKGKDKKSKHSKHKKGAEEAAEKEDNFKV